MTIQYTAADLRKIWPRAPQTIIDAFCSARGRAALDRAGITATRTRLAYAFTQPEHEVAGWTIKNLTENINYTAEGAARIWPRRFPGGATDVRAKYGTAPGWQLKMFDDVYGSRMGNRPGTSDGSRHIGRGGPQITGRDGYREVQARTGVPVADNVELCARHEFQPEILAAFWSWKKMNQVADVGDFKGCTKRWNGGQIGAADREHLLKGNLPQIERLAALEEMQPAIAKLDGQPETPEPPPEVIADVTGKERAARNGGLAAGAGGGAAEAGKAGSVQPDSIAHKFIPPIVTWSLIGLGLAAVVVSLILIGRKVALAKKHWR